MAGAAAAAASGGDPYKTAVIDTLVSRVQGDAGADRCVLLLGYRKEMERFIRRGNPGLARRFQLENAFQFDDYDDQALLRILLRNVARRGKQRRPSTTAKRSCATTSPRRGCGPTLAMRAPSTMPSPRAVVRAEARLAALPAAERVAEPARRSPTLSSRSRTWPTRRSSSTASSAARTSDPAGRVPSGARGGGARGSRPDRRPRADVLLPGLAGHRQDDGGASDGDALRSAGDPPLRRRRAGLGVAVLDRLRRPDRRPDARHLRLGARRRPLHRRGVPAVRPARPLVHARGDRRDRQPAHRGAVPRQDGGDLRGVLRPDVGACSTR